MRPSRLRKYDHLNGLQQVSCLPLFYQTNTILRGYATKYEVIETTGPSSRRKWRPTSPFDVKNSLAQWAKDGQWSPESFNRPLPQKFTLEEASKPPRLPSKRPRSDVEDPVPFEGGISSVQTVDRLRGTTMTPNELKTFETLFRAQANKVNDVPNGKGTEPNQFARRTTIQQLHPEPDFPSPLRAIAEEARQLRFKSQSHAAREAEAAEAAGSVQHPQASEYFKAIKGQMDRAPTDVALWEVLQRDVFTKIESCRLDQQAGAFKSIDAVGSTTLRVLVDALPILLIEFMHRIQRVSPGSTLGLVLLPTLKKLGPHAFALGATTELYNQYMRILYRQYTDLDGIDQILTEMDRDVYEFDTGTLDLLVHIIKHAEKATRGQLGPGLQAFWLLDRKLRGIRKLNRWSSVAEHRIAATALRKAREQAADLEVEED